MVNAATRGERRDAPSEASPWRNAAEGRSRPGLDYTSAELRRADGAPDSEYAMNGPKHFSMLREFHLADFFTLANAACGVAGVFFAMRYTATHALNDFLFAAASPRPHSRSTSSTAASRAGATRIPRSAASSIRWPT